MRRRGCFLLFAAGLLFGSSVTARAQAASGAPAESTPADWVVPRRAVSAGVDAALTTSPDGPTVDSRAAALRLDAGYLFANGLGVSLDAGFVAAGLELEGQAARGGTFPGNVLLGVSFERVLRSGLEAGVSFRAGAPLALYPGGIDQNRLAELAYTMAASAQGFREPFVWQMNAVPLVLGGRAALALLEWLTLESELFPAFLVSVNQRPSRAAVLARADVSAAAGAFLGHAGLNYFASGLPLENHERDQLAVRFGAGAELDGQRVLLDASVGLDPPYGAFRRDPHPFWGVGLVFVTNVGAAR